MSIEPTEQAALWTGFRALQREAHATATQSGFHDVDEVTDTGSPLWKARVSQMVMNAVGELCEAHDIHQRGKEQLDEWYWSTEGKPEGFPIELADAVIRILDTAETLKIDLAGAIFTKMEFNKTREHLHGKQF